MIKRLIITISSILLLLAITYRYFEYRKTTIAKNLIYAIGGLPDDYTVKMGDPIVIKCQTSPKKIVEWGIHTPLLDQLRNYIPQELNTEDIDKMVQDFHLNLEGGKKLTLYSDKINTVDKGKNNLTVMVFNENNNFFIELRYRIIEQ